MLSSAAPLPTNSAQRPRGASTRVRKKGQQTKQAIVETALGLAMHFGLESLSIGTLADAMGMSKSGVFAHFGSREELQISVVREYHHCFEQEVFYPAMSAPRGVARLRALFSNWMQRSSVELDSGCIYISGAIEYGDKPGPVRDALVESVMTWHSAMRRAITQTKQLGELAQTLDEDQMLFEIHGLILALHYDARFLKNPGSIDRALTGFDNILSRFSTPVKTRAARTKASRAANPQ